MGNGYNSAYIRDRVVILAASNMGFSRSGNPVAMATKILEILTYK